MKRGARELPRRASARLPTRRRPAAGDGRDFCDAGKPGILSGQHPQQEFPEGDSTMTRVLVFGASGYVGTHPVPCLAVRGWPESVELVAATANAGRRGPDLGAGQCLGALATRHRTPR